MSSSWPKIEVFYRLEWTKGGATWKWILSILKFRNKYYKQLDREKVDEKNGVICLVSMFPSWIMVLKLSKKVHFLQFCADLSKKSKFIKAIFTYMHLKGLVTHFQKMVLFIVLWLTILEILVFEIEEFS